MRLITFSRFMYQILRKRPANLDWIQNQGLLAVKLSQIFALRPDLLSIEKCRQLQTLYGQASTIPSENVLSILEEKAPIEFHDSVEWFDKNPLAAASVGQVHRARLKTGQEVVVKIIKADHKKKFKKDVFRMKRWLKILIKIFLSFVILTVAPIGLTGNTPHSLGSPIDLNSLFVSARVMLAVSVIGKL